MINNAKDYRMIPYVRVVGTDQISGFITRDNQQESCATCAEYSFDRCVNCECIQIVRNELLDAHFELLKIDRSDTTGLERCMHAARYTESFWKRELNKDFVSLAWGGFRWKSRRK